MLVQLLEHNAKTAYNLVDLLSDSSRAISDNSRACCESRQVADKKNSKTVCYTQIECLASHDAWKRRCRLQGPGPGISRPATWEPRAQARCGERTLVDLVPRGTVFCLNARLIADSVERWRCGLTGEAMT